MVSHKNETKAQTNILCNVCVQNNEDILLMCSIYLNFPCNFIYFVFDLRSVKLPKYCQTIHDFY